MADVPPTATPARRGPGLWPLLLLALAFLPGMIAHLGELWARPWYHWSPLALLAALAFAARAVRDAETPAEPGSRWVWLPLLVAALGLLAAAAWWSSAWLGWLAGLFALAGSLFWCGGWTLFRAMLPSFVMLLVLLTLPLGWDDLIVQRVERMILSGASRMLYGLSVPHLLYPGGVALSGLKLPQQELFAGLHGLPGVLVLGLIWLLAWRRGPARIGFTLLATAALLLPGEVLRVVWAIASSDTSSKDMFLSPRAGYLVFGLWAVSFLLFLSVDQFMRFLTTPRSRPDAFPDLSCGGDWPGTRSALGLTGSGSSLSWAAAGLAVALGLAQCAAIWREVEARMHAGPPAPSALRSDARFTLPEWPDWRSLSASNSLAQPATVGASRGVWHRQRNDLALVISLSGPLPGFATPIPAYQERLWRLTGWAPAGLPGGSPPPYAEAEFKRDNLFFGLLWFGVFDESGQWLAPSIRGVWSGAASEPVQPAARPAYLVQAFVVCPRDLSAAERDEARRRFEDARQALARQLAAQVERKP